MQITAISLFTPEYGYAVSILFNFNSTYTVKVKHPEGGNRKMDEERYYEQTNFIDIEEALPYLLEIFQDAEVITANGKFDSKVAKKYGFYIFKITEDTNTLVHYLNPDDFKALKLNVKKHLGITMNTYEETVKQKAGNIDWTVVDFDDYADYSAKDAFYTYFLAEKLCTDMEDKKIIRSSYENIGLPISPIVADMEYHGVNIDIPMLKDMSIRIHKEINKLEETIYNMAGVEFNIGSSKQLGEIFYDKFNYPVLEHTAKGARALSENILKALDFKGYPMPKYILAYRKLSKLANTYIDSIPQMVDEDGMLRGSFNENGTVTGRFSSSQPNLQNQPNNNDYPVRASFKASGKDRTLIVGDYSQIELRVLAHFSKDRNLIKAFNEGKDLHQQTADEINKITGLPLTRSQGKTLNFATVFLMSAASLRTKLNAGLAEEVTKGKITEQHYNEHKISLKQSKVILSNFFKVYNGIKGYISALTTTVQDQGSVTTLSGFSRPIPELKTNKFFSSGKRKAINTRVQGSAADLIKMAMIKCVEALERENLDCKMILQVHDELVFDVAKKDAERSLDIITDIAENIFPACIVPLIFEAKIMDNWAEMKGGKAKKEEMPLWMYLEI